MNRNKNALKEIIKNKAIVHLVSFRFSSHFSPFLGPIKFQMFDSECTKTKIYTTILTLPIKEKNMLNLGLRIRALYMNSCRKSRDHMESV